MDFPFLPTIPVATASQLGIVQPDGTIITVSAGAITVPKAAVGTFGVCEPDGSTITAALGVLSAVGGGGDFKQLANITTSSSATSFTYSSISGSYSALLLGINGSCSISNQYGTLEFNADTGAHYGYQALEAFNNTGSSAFGSANVTQSGPVRAYNTGNISFSSLIFIPNYANTTFAKTAITYSGSFDTGVNGVTITNIVTWNPAVQAAINSMTYGLQGGHFIDGTYSTLWGLK